MTPPGALEARVQARVGHLAVDVHLETSRTLVLVGPNGAGKTTLLSLLLGVLPVASGRIAIGDRALLDTAAGVDLPLEHRRIGYVPQDYALFPHMTVRENVEFALRSAPHAGDPAARLRRVTEVLDDFGLTGLAARRPEALSGGEKQRVALARALSVRPHALLLDEPLAALDVHSRHDVRAVLARTLGELGLPTVVVTHDAADARQLGHQIAVLEAGSFTQRGTWDQLVARPASPFVKAFVAGPAPPALALAEHAPAAHAADQS